MKDEGGFWWGEKCDHSPDPLCHSGKLSLTSLGDEN